MARAPTLEAREVVVDGQKRMQIRPLGDWSIHGDIGKNSNLAKQLKALMAQKADLLWDLTDIGDLDSVGSMMLWRLWQEKLPEGTQMRATEAASFERLSQFKPTEKIEKPRDYLAFVVATGEMGISLWRGFVDIVYMIGMLHIQVFRLIFHPRYIPWREFSANVYRAGFQAMPISALVGSMIGLALSYLFSIQLRNYGADSTIVPILGIGITREMGPLIAAILIAGRSGSSMTAQIGVMKITEEIDALSVMGISPGLRLALPKVLALVVVTPFIIAWCSATAILGGLLASKQVLNIGVAEFLITLPKDMMFTNLWIALIKGGTFGLFIGIIACHFGLKIKQNSESLSLGTTASVVASITVVILLDAIYAILLQGVGL